MGFADQVKAFQTKALVAVEAKCYRIVYKLFTGTIQDTPVLKGDLINNWFPQLNTFSSATSSSYDMSGSGSLSRVDEVVNHSLFYSKDASVTLTNNLNYAYRAEMLGWPSEDNPRWVNNVGPYLMRHKNLIKIKTEYN